MNKTSWERAQAMKSNLGEGVTDSQGLPAYRFSAVVPVETRSTDGKPYPLDPDPFLLLGNDRLTVFPRVSGLFRLVSGERGWMRLNEPTLDAPPNGARLGITTGGNTTEHELLGLSGVCADPGKTSRTFGCGYAVYEMQVGGQTTVRRRLGVPPSSDDRGVPALVIDVSVTNESGGPADYHDTESVLSRVALGIELNVPDEAKAVRFLNRLTVDPNSPSMAVTATADADDPGILRPRDEANKYSLCAPRNHNPGAHVPMTFRERNPGAHELEATAGFHLEPGATAELRFVVGLDHDSTLNLGEWID